VILLNVFSLEVLKLLKAKAVHIKIECIAFICYGICSSYNFLITGSKLLKRSAAAGLKFRISAHYGELNT
jgi:hypothetical protein